MSKYSLVKLFFNPFLKQPGFSHILSTRVFDRLVLSLYALELVFNRTLMRTLIFIPPNPVRSGLEFLTSYLGLFALNATLILPLFGMIASFTGLGLVFLFAGAADFLGFFKVKYLLLPLAVLLTFYKREMAPAGLMLALMVLASSFTHLYIGWATTLLWSFLPLVYILRNGIVIDRWSYASTAIAALLLVGTLFNPYHVGQVFILAMGIVNPWLLPLGLFLYGIAPRNRLLTAILLTGPTLQISNQVMLLSYYAALEIREGLPTINQGEETRQN